MTSSTHARRWSGILAALALLLVGLVPPASASGTGTISGRAVDAQNNPVQHVMVQAHAPGGGIAQEVYTDADGRYTLTAAPDSYWIIFSGGADPGYVRQVYPSARFIHSAGAQLVTVAAGQAVRGIDVRLTRGASISGTVTDGQGNPIAGISVSIQGVDGTDGWGSHPITDAQGRYTVTQLGAGSYVLGFQHGVSNPLWRLEYYRDFHPPAGDGPITWMDTLPRIRVTTGGSVTGVDMQLDPTTNPRRPFSRVLTSPDLTGDGRGDVLGVDSVGRLHVFAGRGDGGMELRTSLGTGWSRFALYAPGDWDGDGRGDLLGRDGSGNLFLFRGNGAGGMADGRQVGRGWGSYRIVPTADVSGDRRPDLLAIDRGGKLWLYPGDGSGGFAARSQVGSGWGGVEMYPAGHMNRDRFPDLLGIDMAGRMWFYPGLGGGTSGAAVQIGRGWTGVRPSSGVDLTSDGVGDLLLRSDDGRLLLYAGIRSSGFARAVEVGRRW